MTATRFDVYGHRGARGLYPENTLEGAARTPMRCIVRLALQGTGDHRFNPRILNRPRRTRAWSSRKPSTRSARKRRRHSPTVMACTPSSRVTALFSPQSAQAKMMRARFSVSVAAATGDGERRARGC